MKMRSFKYFDLIGQIIILVLFTIASLIRFDGTFVIGYIAIGCWQLGSLVTHFAKEWYTRKRKTREMYQRISLMVLTLMGLSFMIPMLYYVWLVMLFAAPVMAITYLIICVKELKEMNTRPLHLI